LYLNGPQLGNMDKHRELGVFPVTGPVVKSKLLHEMGKKKKGQRSG